jgi:hypothetical protein
MLAGVTRLSRKDLSGLLGRYDRVWKW